MGRTPSTTSSTRTFQPSKQPVEDPKAPRKKPQLKLPVVKFWFSPWVLVALSVALSAFMYVQYQQAQDKIQTTTPAAAKQQVTDTVTKVSKLIILPKGQTPTVATVVHADKLKDQPFFAQAQDGDKVLVYNQQKQAILYRPSTNQLVNVSTVSVTPAASATSSSH